MFYKYLTKVCLPTLLEKYIKDADNVDMTVKDVLKENHITTLNMITIHKWLSKLGFCYVYSPK